ncbi:MAG TPA: hypothetical protein VJB34_08735 [Bdellovibrionota bacterium]|nr:hypothetical protein [Bdellovibrionota bacterium]
MRQEIMKIYVLLLLFILVMSNCTSKPPKNNRSSYDQVLFTFSVLVYAASEIADEESKKILSKFLLYDDKEKYPAIENAFPIREKLRNLVSKLPYNLKQRALNHLVKFPTWNTMYNAHVLETFNPYPLFTPTGYGPTVLDSYPQIYKKRNELSSLLQLAYKEAKIEGNWIKNFEQLWHRDQFLKERIEEIIKNGLQYLRWDTRKESLPEFDVVLNPFMTPGNGANAIVSKTKVQLIIGPLVDKKEREIIVAHEFLHQPVYYTAVHNKAVIAAIKNSACAFKLVKENWGYTEWRSYMIECLVRSLSYRVAEVHDRDTGFFFEKFFSQELIEFEKSKKPFALFLKESLENLKVQYCEKT